jgi:hypothetical protein
MNNLIKKIIRESLDNDWSWTEFEPVKPRKKGEVRVGDVYTIYDSNESIRYVLEIVKIDDYNSMIDDEDDEDDDYDGSGTIHYKIHVTTDEEDEPVGGIRTVTKKRAKRLIVRDNYWVLTDSLDKIFNPLKEEAEDDLDWMREVLPVGEMVIDALKSDERYRVITEYDDKGNLIELEIYDRYDSGRFFGIVYKNISYSDVLEKSKESFNFCLDNDSSEEITRQYQQIYNLLKEYQYKSF